MAEHTIRSIHHVSKELVLHLRVVRLALQLDPVGLLDADLQLSVCLAEVLVDVVGAFEVGSLTRILVLRVLVDHDPVLVRQIDGLLNRQLLQRLLIALDHLA